MKKLLYAIILIVGASLLSTEAAAQQQNQNENVYDKTYSISVYGGPLMSLNENHFSYREHGEFIKLFTGHIGAAFETEFTPKFGVRFSASYANNAGAKNSRESNNGFYPYRFSSLNAFVDFMFDPRGKHPVVKSFRPRLYAGIGMGYSFNFHDKYDHSPLHRHNLDSKKFCNFGFRLGANASIPVSNQIDIFADLCAEAYTDRYNGQKPTQADLDEYYGYAGFPFDIRIVLSFGVKLYL